MINKNIDIRDACFEEVYKIMEKDKNVIFLSDDIDAFVLQKIKMKFPKQYINVGVAEQNLMDLAAGLATCGKKVFVFGICSYITGRCFEQIKFSIASMKLPVVIIGIGAGFSFPFDGPTHHGTTDVAIMRTIPEVTILNPCDAQSSGASVNISYKSKVPVYIRLDKGIFPQIYNSSDDFKKGVKIVKPLKEINIFSTGYMTQQVVKAYAELSSRELKIGLIDIFSLKPLNEQKLKEIVSISRKVIVLEENSAIGGLCSSISELIGKYRIKTSAIYLAIEDKQFMEYGSREFLLKENSLDLNSITKIVLQNN